MHLYGIAAHRNPARMPFRRGWFEGGDAARHVPATDVDAWGEAMVEVLRDDAGRDRLATAGRARAEQFTPERFVAQTRAVYREAIEVRASG